MISPSLPFGRVIFSAKTLSDSVRHPKTMSRLRKHDRNLFIFRFTAVPSFRKFCGSKKGQLFAGLESPPLCEK